MLQLVIDTDPGHDDAIAIMTALAYPQHLQLHGLTTVAGNQTIDKVTTNALKILSYLDHPLPVARGAEAPLSRKLVTGAGVHGESGLGGVELPPPGFGPLEEDAESFIARILEEASEPVTLVALGPQTNIALLLQARPELRRKIGLISFMGGGIVHGNRTMAAEFNIYADPEAARVVFRSGVPLVMSGLDVTDKAYIEEKEIAELSRRGRASRLVAELLKYYGEGYRKRGLSSPVLHDPCAIAYLIRPDLFTWEEMFVDVETRGELTRGMTVADMRPGNRQEPNVRVLTDVNRAGFIELIFEALARLDTDTD